MELTGSEGNI